MDPEMFRQTSLVLVSFAASVALERLRPHVGPRVTLQLTRRNASVIALVTLEWFFACVHPHHVIFQLTSCNEGKLASCASMRLFPRVGPFVILQITRLSTSIIALVTLERFFSCVLHDNVNFQLVSCNAGKLAVVHL